MEDFGVVAEGASCREAGRVLVVVGGGALTLRGRSPPYTLFCDPSGFLFYFSYGDLPRNIRRGFNSTSYELRASGGRGWLGGNYILKPVGGRKTKVDSGREGWNYRAAAEVTELGRSGDAAITGFCLLTDAAQVAVTGAATEAAGLARRRATQVWAEHMLFSAAPSQSLPPNHLSVTAASN